MKTSLKIFGVFFLLLSLTIGTMPGVQAFSLSQNEHQAILFSELEPEAKVSSLLSLQVEAKLRCQQVLPTDDELSMMQAGGMNTEDLEMQRIFIHLAQEPTLKQLEEMEALGIIPYPESWIPPVGNFPTGFIVADMPVDGLGELATKDYIAQLDTAEQLLEPQNDLAATAINADDVWGSGYTGEGVRIAVIDSGLDTSHPDIPTPVASKDYSAWPALDDTIANSVTGHGTHVAGSVLGRGTQSSGAASEYKGMAPDADLIFLKIGNDTTAGASLDAMTNAIRAAVDTYEADIITMSYGGWGDYHDGTRQSSQAVDYAFSQGAVVFISAGNDADDAEHYSGTVDAYSSTGFIQVDVSDSTGSNAGLGFNLVWFDGLAESNDLTLEYYDSTQTAMGDIWAGDQEESWKGTEHELSGYGPEAGWYYYLPSGSPTYYLRVTNDSSSEQFFHIYFEGIASNGASVEFDDPDLFYTLCSPADAEKAIAVGAYTSRKNWTAYDGVSYHFINPEQTVGTMASFSSRGPRVDSDALQKPNLVAPGSAIISVRDQDVYAWPGGANAYFVDNDGLNLNGSGPADYYVMHGTSMACPIAAGAAALMLEANPALKGHPGDVKNLLQSTANSVNANDDIDGYGLLDIQAAVDATASEFELEWLFMVYLDADNNLESAGIDDMNEMEVAGSTDDVAIVVQMDRAERDYYDDTTNGNWTDAKRFYVTQDSDTSIINSPVIEDLGEVNMGDPAVLTSFIEWSIANYPAKRYALVLWNHGSGWRLKEIDSEAVKSICVDDESGDELSMTELRSALNAANLSTGETLDIVGFDACLMQMVEVAYQVMGSASRPLVDMTVGSEETEPGDGWDYAAALAALIADPTMTPAELGTQIVNDYVDSYSSSLDITQSAVDLDYMEALSTAVDSFAIAMTNATGDWSAISTARSSAQEYYYYYYIDLYHFAQLVNQDATISQTVRDAASDVMTAVTNAVVAEGHTASVGDSHGISIYYPETSGDYFSDYETDVLFTADTHWDDFLYAILFTSPEAPEITVSPTSFDVTLAADTTESYTLTISNDGTGDLTYNISDQETVLSVLPEAQVGIPKPESAEAIGKSSEEVTGVVPVIPSYDQRTPAEVALFKDSNPWSYTAIEDILTDNGTSYDVYNSSQMGVVDLSSYEKVITASVQGDDFWDALEANKTWFESYVSDGGVLEMHLCAYSGSNSPGKVYPGGFVFYDTNIEEISIVDSTHPVVNTPNTVTDAQLDDWYYSAHGWFDVIPAGGDVVLKSTTNDEPVWVEAAFGSGHILATTQTVEWRAGWGYPEFLENMTVYTPTPEADCSWLSEAPISGTVAAGGSDSVTVTIDTTGLAEGTYTAEIVIASNDADEASTSVPVTLQVGLTDPDITVSPTSFDVTLAPGTTEDYTLTIGNDGGAELTYDISDQEATGGGEPTEAEGSLAAIKEEKSSRSPDLTLVNTEYDMAIAVEDVTADNGIGRYTEATADEMKLLYGYPYAWSSYMTVQIDGSDYYQDSSEMDSYVTQMPTIDGNSITTQWSLPSDVGVSLRLTLQQDTTKYQATVTNNGASSHAVNVRFLLDTMLAYNDGSPFIVPGVGNVTTEQEYTNPVFDHWQSTDSLSSPTLTSNCTFVAGNKPYKVQFAYWPEIYNAPFDYTATIGQDITGDTAVGMYWNLGTLSAGESEDVVFYYGTTEAIIGSPDVSIVTLFTDSSSYLPEEDVTIYVDVGNGGDADLTDGSVTVSVEDPEGTPVFDDSTAITVVAGEVASCNFTYSLPAEAALGEYTITADVYDSEAAMLDEATATFTVGGGDCSWLSESPISGTVAAGSSDPITVTIDTTGLSEGTYNGEIIIASNDPDEASVTVPVTLHVGAADLPTVTSVNPDYGEQGETLSVNIDGTNLSGATAVSFGDGITVNSFSVVGPTEILANISIDTTATPGLRDVSVTTPDGTGTLTDGFTVVAAGAVTVSVDAPATAAPDSDFTASIDITQVTELDSCNYDITFDSSVLRLDDVTSGLIGSTTIPVDLYNEVSPGTYRVVQNVPGLTGVSGSGYLAELHFHVIGSEGDSSAITLSNGTLSDAQAGEIEATWVGDSVDITSAQSGDANGDGVVNALDITKVERIIVGLDAETPGADANGDGMVNALDITKIERIIVGLD
jgi:clostripain